MQTTEALLNLMPSQGHIQFTQTQFRQQLVDSWGISPGDRVLEIGCGQGDTTLVLMDAVGPNGHVTAVDIADPDYGSPLTVGESMAHLKAGPLGDRLSYQFEFDPGQMEPEGRFDVAVLSLCTWYFRDLEAIQCVLTRIGAWSPRLLLAEWDMQPRHLDQFAHWLAILLQGQIEIAKVESFSNVRTPYSREALERLLDSSGWNVARTELLEPEALQDANWEVGMCLRESPRDISELPFGKKQRDWLQSQLDVLQRLSGPQLRPLPVYSVIAERKNA